MTKKAKGSEEKDLEKKPNALVRTWRRFSNWCHEMKVELKKVVWPKRKELVRACLVIGVFIWVVDGVAAAVIRALINLFKG